MLVTLLPRMYFCTWLPKMDLKDLVVVLLSDTKVLLFKVTWVKFEQYWNALSPMLSMLLGMVMEVKPVQP